MEDEPPALVAEAKQRFEKGMASFEAARARIGEAGSELAGLRGELIKVTTEIKEEALADKSAAARKEALLQGAQNAKSEEDRARLRKQAEEIAIREEFPFAEKIKVLEGSREKHRVAIAAMKEDLNAGVAALPEELESKAAGDLVDRVRKKEPHLVDYLEDSLENSEEWRYDKPVGWFSSTTSFFFGKDWVTNSSLHDFYGLLPLFTGSLTISVDRPDRGHSRSRWEPRSTSTGSPAPTAERSSNPSSNSSEPFPPSCSAFSGSSCSARPFVKSAGSHEPFLDPRLSDARAPEHAQRRSAARTDGRPHHVHPLRRCDQQRARAPSREASLALGGSTLQTVLKVVVPTAVSGIWPPFSSVSGVSSEKRWSSFWWREPDRNPDFGLGLGVITQPAHTMTGIIAQEMGEVTADTIHYRALFSVGLVLFTISLLINISARNIIRRFGHAA